MNMSQRARQMLKQWAVLFGVLILLHGLLFLGWVILEPYSRRSLIPTVLLIIVYLIIFTAILLIFYQRVNLAASPPEYRETHENGVPATAKVLTIERTRWRVKRNRNFRLQSRPTRREYQMLVRVTRPDEPDYEASLAEFLTGDQVPEKGAVIPIKVHPQRPDIIVMIL
jgi:hypothetical protein